METTNNKTIAKNTIALYFRMMISMAVSLFTSRVVLQYLGVEDYGIQTSVGGIVGMLSYLSGALQVGSSRFLTYELGTGDKEKLRKTFSSVLSVHILFGLIVILLGETIGLWVVTHKMIIPAERMTAALWCFHLSLASFFVTVTQVPYSASIVSHEKMSLYAYTSIIDVTAKLLIVYMLTLVPWDRLIFYSTLFFIVGIAMKLYYRWYCAKHFEETHYNFSLDRDITKHILQYSGWNVFATTSVAMISHGVTIITNLFFSPGVVAARAIASQVDQTIRRFFFNFKMASDPQMVKKYAAGDFEGSKRILFQTAKYGYFLMLIFCYPITLVAEPLLRLWLGQVPEYSVVYLQYAVLTSLAAVFDHSFYGALSAKGQIKENSICSSLCFFAGFLATYILFYCGYPPVWSGIMLFVSQCAIAFIVKPIMMVKIVGYRYAEIFRLFIDCAKVSLVAILVPTPIYIYKEHLGLGYYTEFLMLVLVSVASVGITVWTIGLDDVMKKKLLRIAKNKLSLK